MGVRSGKDSLYRIVPIALAAGLLATAALAAVPAKRATVGFFVVKLARSLGFQPTTAPEARKFLAGVGITFDARLEDPLTEGEASRLLSGLGVATEPSSDPEQFLKEATADRLAGIAARGLLAGGAGAPPRPEGALPPSCQALERSLCFQCCLASLGPIAVVPQRAIDLCNSSCTLMGSPPTSPSSP